MANEMDKDLVKGGVANYGFNTTAGTSIKGSGIVTGMDKLVNPKYSDQTDQIFDSSVSRDINVGETMDQGGIKYKGLKTENPIR